MNHWAEDDEVVADGMECPHCGEPRQEWLICGDDDTVKCATCGMVYALKVAADGA
jgi:uncharacterized Zn finger protein